MSRSRHTEAQIIGALKQVEAGQKAEQVASLSFDITPVCRVASSIPGAVIVRQPQFLSSLREEVFCEFEVGGVRFVAWEPFGDNSRYWIGPEPARWVSQIVIVREAFLKA